MCFYVLILKLGDIEASARISAHSSVLVLHTDTLRLVSDLSVYCTSTPPYFKRRFKLRLGVFICSSFIMPLLYDGMNTKPTKYLYVFCLVGACNITKEMKLSTLIVKKKVCSELEVFRNVKKKKKRLVNNLSHY